MTRLPALLALTLPLAACSVDASVGHLVHPDDLDAAPPDPDPDPDGAPAAPDWMFYPHGTGGFAFYDDGMIITTGGFDDTPGSAHTTTDLVRLPPTGEPEILIPDLGAQRLLQDGDQLFTVVGYQSDPVSGSGPVLSIDRSTLAVTTLASGVVGDSTRDMIALDGDWVYFTEQAPSADGLSGGRVSRVPKAGGSTEVVADDLVTPWGLAFDADYVYVAEDMAGRVTALPRDPSCSPFYLASGRNRPARLLVVGDWLYFTERGNTYVDGMISRVPRPTSACATAASESPEVLVTGLGHPTWMLVDGDELYWSAYFSGLQRAPLAGGTAETLMGCYGGAFGTDPPYDEENWTVAPSQGCDAFVLHDGAIYINARFLEPHPTYTLTRDGIYAVPISSL